MYPYFTLEGFTLRGEWKLTLALRHVQARSTTFLVDSCKASMCHAHAAFYFFKAEGIAPPFSVIVRIVSCMISHNLYHYIEVAKAFLSRNSPNLRLDVVSVTAGDLGSPQARSVVRIDDLPVVSFTSVLAVICFRDELRSYPFQEFGTFVHGYSLLIGFLKDEETEHTWKEIGRRGKETETVDGHRVSARVTVSRYVQDRVVSSICQRLGPSVRDQILLNHAWTRQNDARRGILLNACFSILMVSHEFIDLQSSLITSTLAFITDFRSLIHGKKNN
ncbi:hypothetical protein VNO77_38898 [Canavalia gladiata]|uniref:Uncharacterized protein n=1 Tax=Canavalia gladiata TaxID=3824 RepID=A0AAN9KDE7_CANGL